MNAAAKKPEPRPRTNLRLEPEVWRALDEARRRRPGNVSRNTWITEAVLEKLNRDASDESHGGARHA